MKIFTKKEMIARNAKIGKYSGILSLLVLGGGLYVSFRHPEQVWISLAALAVGFVLSQISMYFVNRWGRSPRPDEALNQALKGLDDRYALYHYSTPASHLLVGPAGLWILLPYYHKGKITYNEKKERWQRKGGNLYLRIFAQDSIGRPTKDIAYERKSIKKELSQIPDFELPPIQAALVFTHEEAQIEADNTPHPTLHVLQLKKFIRKRAKSRESLSMIDVKIIQDSLGLEK